MLQEEETGPATGAPKQEGGDEPEEGADVPPKPLPPKGFEHREFPPHLDLPLPILIHPPCNTAEAPYDLWAQQAASVDLGKLSEGMKRKPIPKTTQVDVKKYRDGREGDEVGQKVPPILRNAHDQCSVVLSSRASLPIRARPGNADAHVFADSNERAEAEGFD